MNKREIYNLYQPILNIGYCGYDELIKYNQFKVVKIGYNSGQSGWNWDAYMVYDTINSETFILMDGYRNTLDNSDNDYIKQLNNFIGMKDSALIFKYQNEFSMI